MVSDTIPAARTSHNQREWLKAHRRLSQIAAQVVRITSCSTSLQHHADVYRLQFNPATIEWTAALYNSCHLERPETRCTEYDVNYRERPGCLSKDRRQTTTDVTEQVCHQQN